MTRLFSLSLLAALFISESALSQTSSQRPAWALLYFMPYDNNLSVFADTVEHMIIKGSSSENVVSAIFRDDAVNSGGEIIEIKNGVVKQTRTNQERSGSIKSLRFFLDWATKNVRADHFAFIFLDHGGGPRELCLDESPVVSFLHVDSVRDELIHFNKARGQKLDLIFLQVCAKSAFEPLYELKDCSSFTMASENVLGAPNYYYQKAIESITSKTTATELAKQIVASEHADMFYSLTLINNQKLTALKTKLDKFLSSLPQEKIAIDPTSIKYISYYQTIYWDLLSFIQSLEINNQLITERNEVTNLIKDAVVFHYINAEDKRMDGYCGLSLLAPTLRNYNEENLKFNFFQKSELPRLAGKWVKK